MTCLLLDAPHDRAVLAWVWKCYIRHSHPVDDISAGPAIYCSKEAKRTKTRELPLVSGGLPGFKIAKGQPNDVMSALPALQAHCALMHA